MAIEGFQYEEFSKNLAQQASEVVPPDIQPSDKAYIINLVFNYCMLAGEAINNDTSIQINAQQACIICQLIGEWTFHKAIDVIKSNLPLELRDETLQKVAFTVFEIAKIATVKNIPIQQIIPLVEQHVKRAFDEAIADLTKRGAIDETLAQNAISQSNIDNMAQQQEEAQAQAEPQVQEIQPDENEYQTEEEMPEAYTEEAPPSQAQSKRILKLASLALLMKSLPPDKVHSLLRKFNQKDSEMILQYFNMPDLQDKLDSKIAIQCLKEIKKNIPQTKSYSSDKINRKIKNIVNNSAKEKISAIIAMERENIKKIVDATSENKKINLPPRIAAIVCNYLEEKIKR